MHDSGENLTRSLDIRSQAEIMRDLVDGTVMSRPDLVEGIVPQGLTVFFGEPGVGKTFLGIDLAVSVAHGRPWLEQYDVVQRGVLYVCPEGTPDLRVAAIVQDKGLRLDGPLYVCSTALPLTSEAVFRQLEEEIIKLGRVGLLVLDPWSAAIRGLDENSHRDMSFVIGELRDLCERLGLAAVIIHHCAKRDSGGVRRERGSTARRGSADAIIEVRDSKEGLSLECSKAAREGRPFEAIPVHFVELDVLHPAPTNPDALDLWNRLMAGYGRSPAKSISNGWTLDVVSESGEVPSVPGVPLVREPRADGHQERRAAPGHQIVLVLSTGARRLPH
jgi:KaiC/GvpD/RAD55 family RecA-like ATPase